MSSRLSIRWVDFGVGVARCSSEIHSSSVGFAAPVSHQPYALRRYNCKYVLSRYITYCRPLDFASGAPVVAIAFNIQQSHHTSSHSVFHCDKKYNFSLEMSIYTQ